MRGGNNPNQTIPVAFPDGGLDESGAYADQRSRTTPVALNVVPWDGITGRRRPSRRPALVRYCDESVGSGSIQDINSVAISRDQTTPSGKLFSVNGASGGDNGRVYGPTGSTVYTTADQQGTQTLGCVDNDGNFYMASVDSGGTTVGLCKVNPNGVGSTVWTVSMAVSGSGTGCKIWGLAALDGVVYLWLIDIVGSGIYRFDGDDGTRLDPQAWLDTNSGLVSATATAVRAYQNMAFGGSVIGVVGGRDSKLILQRISTNGAIASSTTLQDPFVSYQSRLVADQGGNFYVLTNASGAAANQLIKVNTAGNLVAAFGTAGVITSSGSGAVDIAYEPTTYSMCVVGTAIFPNVTGAGADDSYQRFGAVDGVLVHHGKPDSQTTWNAICADGVGGMRIRRSAASGDDLASIQMTGTVNWKIATGLGTTTQMLWLQCTGYNLASRGSPTNQGRFFRRLAVVDGALRRFTTQDVTTIDAAFVSPGPVTVPSALHQLKLYYADGESGYRYYDAQTDSTGTLAASAGALPQAANGSYGTLIAMWRDRLLIAGVDGDLQNYFASKQGDATNWDYNPTPPNAQQAFAGNLVRAGRCPDVITALVPWSDDVCIFGCDHEIWRMTGDPADGGGFDQVSAVTGMARGQAFCFDPQGTLYFWGTRGGLYRMMGPQQKPQLVSGPIQDRALGVDLNAVVVRMVWWDDYEGVLILISPKDPNAAATHYFWDRGTEIFSPITKQTGAFSWWPFQFANTAHNAVAVHTFDGDDPDDRAMLLGGRDGVVRTLSVSATSDDGTAITSQLYMTPIRTKTDLAFVLKDLQVAMAQNSPGVNLAFHAGETVQAAVNNGRAFLRSLQPGRNRSISVRVRGHAVIPELYSSAVALPWSLENMAAVIEVKPEGPARRIFIKSEPPELPDNIPTPEPEPDPGTPWTPLLYPFRLWVYGDDASLASLSDGDSVDSWTNRGGAGGVVWDGGGVATKPIIKKGANGLNGLPIVRFNGTNEYLLGNLAVSNYWSASAKSIFMVVKANSNVTNNSKGPLSDAAAFCDLYQRSTGVWGFQNWDGNYDDANVTGTLNAWTIITAWHGAGQIGLRLDGDGQATAASGNTTNVAGTLYLGRRNGAGYIQCDIAEVIITNEEVPDTIKQYVEGYLAWKYDLTGLLPSSHPWKNTTPVV